MSDKTTTKTEAVPPKLVKVTAISMAPPGHFRGGHFWSAGSPSWAELTPAQLAQVEEDTRLQVLKGTIENAIPEADVLAAMKAENSDTKILAEAERILKKRAQEDNKRRTANERR